MIKAYSSQVPQTFLLLLKTKSIAANHRSHRNYGWSGDFNSFLTLNNPNLVQFSISEVLDDGSQHNSRSRI